jgi:PAS domain S-box-containing protein
MKHDSGKDKWQSYEVALTVANLLLLGYVIHLLVANYFSQRDIRKAAEIRIAKETERQADAIGSFLAERRHDIEVLAYDQEILAYFENKSMGMSLKYGLRATLEQARERFGQILYDRSLGGRRMFSSLMLVEDGGEVLIENDELPTGRQLENFVAEREGGVHLGWDPENRGDFAYITVPVIFKGKTVGRIMAWVDLAPLLENTVKKEDASHSRWVDIFKCGNTLPAGNYREHSIPGDIAGQESVVKVNGERIFSKAHIVGTPFDFVMVTPKKEIFGNASPLQQLIGVGAVAAIFLFAMIGLLRHFEYKSMSLAVQESEERLSLALEATNDGVWDWNYQTGAVYYSPRWLEMLGYGIGEVENNISAWENLVHPDDLPHVRKMLEDHFSGISETYESEFRCRTKPGGWKWILARGRSISRDHKGAPLRIVGTHTDITSRKEVETLLEEANRDLENRVKDRTSMLLQSEKMASIGQLAAGIAHEINNPAGFVSGNLETLKQYSEGLMELAAVNDRLTEELAAGTVTQGKFREEIEAVKQRINFDFIEEDISDLLAESLDGMKRIARIVTDLKDFSHIDKEDSVSECDLNELIDKAINVAWNELKYKCVVEREYGSLPPVPLNGGQISQVILNILVNSAQAIEKQGVIKIATSTAAGMALVEIADNGPGIPEEIRTKIFDPFFTTKPVGKGTGLGLHICQKIVNSHNGTIVLDSTEGEGARFSIKLPLQRAKAEGRKGDEAE